MGNLCIRNKPIERSPYMPKLTLVHIYQNDLFVIPELSPSLERSRMASKAYSDSTLTL